MQVSIPFLVHVSDASDVVSFGQNICHLVRIPAACNLYHLIFYQILNPMPTNGNMFGLFMKFENQAAEQ